MRMIYMHKTALPRQGFFMALLIACVCQVQLAHAINSPHPVNESWLSMRSDSYSDAFKILDLYNDNPRSRQAGDVIYSFSQWQLGRQIHPNIALGVIGGWDIYGQHSELAAKIYAQQEVKAGQYDYQLEADMQRTQGLFVAFNFGINQFNVHALLEAGQAFGLTSVDIHGNLSSQDNRLAGIADIDYFYEKDALYHRKLNKTPAGRYVSLSVDLSYASVWGEHRLHMQDLFNQTHWHNAPFTQLALNTNKVSSIDDNGVVSVRPLGSGRETFKSFNQVFPARIEFSNYFKIDNTARAVLGLNTIKDDVWPFIGWQFSRGNMQVRYHVKQQAFAVSQRYNPYFSYQFSSDHLDGSKIQRLQFGIELRY